MEHTGYPLYFPPSEMSFYWRRWPRRCKRRLPSSSRSLSISPFFSLSLSRLSLSLCLQRRTTSKSQRRIVSQILGGGVSGPFRTPAPRFHFVREPHRHSTLSLFLPLVIYNGFSPFFSELQKPRLPCKLVPLVLWSYNYAADLAILCPCCLLPFFPSPGSGRTLRREKRRNEHWQASFREFECVCQSEMELESTGNDKA